MKNDQISRVESQTLLKIAEECLGKAGDFVEFGCYKGDTSLLLGKLLMNGAQAQAPKVDLVTRQKLWLFDSFEGLPEKSAQDASVAGEMFAAGELKVSKREVVEKFKKSGLPMPIIKKGFFENLSPKDLPGKVAFAFLDGDLYRSIKTSLQLVGPRMVPGGVIVVHDYNNPQLPGAARAVDEWTREQNIKITVKETLAILRI